MYINLQMASEHLVAKGLDGQTPRVLRAAIARGKLAAVKDGRAWKTTIENLDEYEARLWKGTQRQGDSADVADQLGSKSTRRAASPVPPPMSESEISARRLDMYLEPQRPRDLRARNNSAEQRKLRAQRNSEATAQLKNMFGSETPTRDQLEALFGREGVRLASDMKLLSPHGLWDYILSLLSLKETISQQTKS